MIPRQLALACALIGAASTAQATSVIPLTLPELSQEADAIVRVKVLDQAARWGAFQDAPAIVSDLEFAVLEVLKGEAPRTLTVFGGTVGEQTLSLIGQPELRAGDEAFVFLITKQDVTCPYVGVWQGVYPVRDGQVWRESTPIVDVVEGAVVIAEDHERGMSPRGFAAEVRRALMAPADFPPLRLTPVRAELPGRAAQRAHLDVDGPAGVAPLRLRAPSPAHAHPERGAQ